MGILDRISTLLKSSANSALDKLQDPEKELELLVVQMEDELKRAREEVVKTRAQVKVVQTRGARMQDEERDWTRREEEAAKRGEQELAGQARARREQLFNSMSAAAEEIQALEAARVAQEAALPRLEARLREVKARKATIRAKLGAQKGLEARMESLSEFERIGDKVESAESVGDAHVEVEEALHGTAAEQKLSERLDALDPKKADVDERLAALKKKLGGKPE